MYHLERRELMLVNWLVSTRQKRVYQSTGLRASGKEFLAKEVDPCLRYKEPVSKHREEEAEGQRKAEEKQRADDEAKAAAAKAAAEEEAQRKTDAAKASTAQEVTLLQLGLSPKIA